MLRLLVLAVAVSAACGAQEPDVNVNSRYTVESVDIAAPQKKLAKLTPGLRDDIQGLVGGKLDQGLLDQLGARLKEELKAHTVAPKITKGDQPEHVKVVFEVSWRHTVHFDSDDTKFAYHGKDGWSGHLNASTRVGKNKIGVGVVSDGEELVERYAGMRAYFRREEIGTDRIQLGFEFQTYHQQWNRDTQQALLNQDAIPGMYRTRYNLEPMLTVILAEPLTLQVGASFERFQTEFPAARKESANAVVTSLRYSGNWEGSGSDKHYLEAGYSLRAASRTLDSDFAYARHFWSASYRFRRDRNNVLLRFQGGRISGRAPLFERFAAGNATTLRGWRKYTLEPAGGDRLAVGSLEYRYRVFAIFYDTGAVWRRGESPEQKHSVGLGLSRDGFFLAVAFPLKYGRAEPIFMVGMNY